jgi:hypothetical protein
MYVCVLDEIGGTEMRREEEKIGPCGAAALLFCFCSLWIVSRVRQMAQI